VDLVDAICDAPFLRNKVTAHKLNAGEFHKRVKTLSVYDVFNVQSLARQLLLKALKVQIRPRKLVQLPALSGSDAAPQVEVDHGPPDTLFTRSASILSP